ncbi:methyltransferase family protein [Streptomyces orinoci]|uniref:Isoprenylcysteine carboxylmethyltransferase family protein n=2 Tax=Streptomyces orinoci TaxID=67339 RepID=A0ABV3K6U2_STRON
MTDAQWRHIALTTDIVCWATFLTVWVCGALYNARRSPAVRKRGQPLQRWSVAAGIAVAVTVNTLLPHGTWDPLTVHVQWLRAIGAVVLIAATAFAIWARIRLGRMWTSTPVAKQGHQLRTDGPYAIVRHPIYTGILGMFIGTALLMLLGGWVVAVLLAVVLAQWKISVEEKLMAEAFPGAYEDYRRRVPRLVPRVWRRGDAGGR